MVAALQEGGQLLCEGDNGLFATLERFMPPDPQGRLSGTVFNMGNGIQDQYPSSFVPADLRWTAFGTSARWIRSR